MLSAVEIDNLVNSIKSSTNKRIINGDDELKEFSKTAFKHNAYDIIKNTVFIGIRLYDINFNCRVFFHNCSFINCDVDSSYLKRLNFYNCYFNFITIKTSYLDKIRITKCKLYHLSIVINNIKDLILSKNNIRDINCVDNIITYLTVSSSGIKNYIDKIRLHENKFNKSQFFNIRIKGMQEFRYNSFVFCNIIDIKYTGRDAYVNVSNDIIQCCISLNDERILESIKIYNYISLSCPSEGSFIGWKKCKTKTGRDIIVKLLIPEDAKRSSSTRSKCRASKVQVLAMYDMDGSTCSNDMIAISPYSENIVEYTIGKIIEVDDFDDNRFNECSTGIHFFIDREVAEDY